ncbi:hypothetical protein EMIT0P171_30123 [Pseudomonas sp. IT-P171]
MAGATDPLDRHVCRRSARCRAGTASRAPGAVCQRIAGGCAGGAVVEGSAALAVGVYAALILYRLFGPHRGLARDEARIDNIDLAAPAIKLYHGRSFADRVRHEVRHRAVFRRPCALLAPRLAVRPGCAGRRA